MVMKHIALLRILEKLEGDCRTTLEHELLEPPRERNGTAWNGMDNNCTRIEWRKNGNGTELSGPLNGRSTGVQQTKNGNFLLTPTVHNYCFRQGEGTVGGGGEWKGVQSHIQGSLSAMLATEFILAVSYLLSLYWKCRKHSRLTTHSTTGSSMDPGALLLTQLCMKAILMSVNTCITIDIIADGTGLETDDVMRLTSVTGVRFL